MELSASWRIAFHPGRCIPNTNQARSWHKHNALDIPARKREGYKISQLECADHVLHIESLKTGKREQETWRKKRANKKWAHLMNLVTLWSKLKAQCIIKDCVWYLKSFHFYENFIKHCYISIGKNLKGFHLSQFRQAVSNWHVLVGPQKICPGRRRCLPLAKKC